MWPNADNATFDYDYYLQNHLPMVEELLGDNIKRVEWPGDWVAWRRARRRPTPPSLTFYFDPVDAFRTAFGPHGGAITGDERNFTNIPTTVQISEVVK